MRPIERRVWLIAQDLIEEWIYVAQRQLVDDTRLSKVPML